MSTPTATAASAPAELVSGVMITVWLLAAARSIAFDRAENQMHTIKAILVATLEAR